MKLSKTEKKRISAMRKVLEANDYTVYVYPFKDKTGKEIIEVVELEECKHCGADKEIVVASGHSLKHVLRQAMKERNLKLEYA